MSLIDEKCPMCLLGGATSPIENPVLCGFPSEVYRSANNMFYHTIPEDHECVFMKVKLTVSNGPERIWYQCEICGKQKI